MLLGLIAILSQGFVLFFFSELFFWARPTEVALGHPHCLDGWLIYSYLGLLLSICLQFFQVGRQEPQKASLCDQWPAIYLCGALYGWFAEGAVVHTMYDSFPINIAHTGLSWHALLSVLIGRMLLPRLLQSTSAGKLLLVSVGLGLYWGYWAVFWWYDLKAAVSPADFLVFSMQSTAALALAYLFSNLCGDRNRVPVWLSIASLVLLAVIYLPYAVTQPVHACIFFTACGITVFFLLKHRQAFGSPPSDQPKAAQAARGLGKVNLRLVGNLFILTAIPATASLVYLFFVFSSAAAGCILPTGWLIYVVNLAVCLWLYVKAARQLNGSKPAA